MFHTLSARQQEMLEGFRGRVVAFDVHGQQHIFQCATVWKNSLDAVVDAQGLIAALEKCETDFNFYYGRVESRHDQGKSKRGFAVYYDGKKMNYFEDGRWVPFPMQSVIQSDERGVRVFQGLSGTDAFENLLYADK
ncbi:hypothetical protein [Herbaspirillum sp.]|uniref:hypothetical protein n=1 Tax=Herbaspirillum sp. TaxID=1890675 RepID=UPI00257BB142|nr:hypothetical protein [Herbaspirillum sp.]|tara:strand:- start:4830 stop:5237 length:408 start_codon:yes stop_codon:yes gene_type:complete